MRRKKDNELTQYEQGKIAGLDEDIRVQRIKLDICKAKADRIERKVGAMKKFEKFLEKVKDANPDEFTDLVDIVSRYD